LGCEPKGTKPGGDDRVSWFEIRLVWAIKVGAAFDSIIFFDNSVRVDDDMGTPKEVLEVERAGGDLTTFVKVVVEG
jgi:hypothetical protein